MKKLLNLFAALLIAISASAQTSLNLYYIDGSLSIGQGVKTFADNSAWMQLGKDTTKKGVLLPKVILDSISTTKRALFVYDLKDSVLYHFDGAKKVRYMTYKDTTWIKSLVGSGGSSSLTFSNGLTHAAGNVTNDLVTGKAGGQTAIGGAGSGESLTLSSTTHATKGKILMGTSAYDEVSNKLQITNVTPLANMSGPSAGNLRVADTTPGVVSLAVFKQTANTTGSAMTLQLANQAGKGGFLGAYAPLWSMGDCPNLANTLTVAATDHLIFGTDMNAWSGGTSYMSWRTGGYADFNEKMRLQSNGNLTIGTTTNPGNKLYVNGTVGVKSSTNSLFSSSSTNGQVTITGDVGVYPGERVLTIAGSGKTASLAMGVGAGGQISDNIPFIGYRTTEPAILHGFSFSSGWGINGISATNVDVFGIRKLNYAKTVITGALNGSTTGSVLAITSLGYESGGGHTHTSGNVTTLEIGGPAGGSDDQFTVSSGTGTHYSILINQALNQTGTASGVTVGVYDSPVFTSSLSRDLRQSFRTDNTSGWSLYAAGGAKLYNAGTIETGATIKTGAPSASGAGLIKVGKILTGSDTNKYLEVDVDGTLYYMRAYTALP